MAHLPPLDERERQYSPSSCIGGDYQPYLRQYVELSATVPAACTLRRDLVYGTKPTNRLDLFVPLADVASSSAPALLVFIHGGYWQELSKESSLFAAGACIDAGFAFAAIDYTLAPAASLLEIVLECRQALRWLHAQAAELGVDPARIVVAGSSAGAHLAAMACVRDWQEDENLAPDLPAGAVLVSGIYALEPLLGTSIAAPLGLTESAALVVSPRWLAHDHFPPTIVCWGEVETDEFKRQSRDFAASLTTTGIAEISCFEIPERNHFDVILDLAQRDTLLGAASLRMLNGRNKDAS